MRPSRTFPTSDLFKGADDGREFLVTRFGEVAHRGVRGLIDQQRELRSLALSS